MTEEIISPHEGGFFNCIHCFLCEEICYIGQELKIEVAPGKKVRICKNCQKAHGSGLHSQILAKALKGF